MDDSPVLAFAADLPNTMLAIAPEKAADLAAAMARYRIRFGFVPDGNFVFAEGETPTGRLILASVPGLELLWVLSYAYWVIYRRAQELQMQDLTRPVSITSADRADTRSAAALLQWAFETAHGRPAGGAWPDGLPRPTPLTPVPASSDVTDERFATEMAACAVAWIYHHELGRMRLGHSPVTVASASEERAADIAASDWVLAGAANDGELAKRGLGIAIATACLAALDLEAPPSGDPARRTHPTGAARVCDSLDHPRFGEDHVVFKFAAYALKIHLDSRAIPVLDRVYDSARDVLGDYCLALHRWASAQPAS